MLSQTDVANLTLGYLGSSKRITDLSVDNTTEAKVIRRNLLTSLKTFLEMHPWGFATSYAALALISVKPSSGYGFVYGFPADALTIREVNIEGGFTREEQYEESKIQFEEILTGTGMTIHADIELAHAKYTRNLDPLGGFPEYFGRGFAAHMSLEVGPSLVTNNFGKVKNTLNEEAQNRIANAISIDLGRKPRPRDPQSPFHSARNR